MDLEEVRNKVIWDIDLDNEFVDRREGFAFLIDVYEENPVLVVYVIKKQGSETAPMKKQPPREMLVQAVRDQGGDLCDDKLFYVNKEVRDWIEKNIFFSDTF